MHKKLENLYFVESREGREGVGGVAKGEKLY